MKAVDGARWESQTLALDRFRSRRGSVTSRTTPSFADLVDVDRGAPGPGHEWEFQVRATLGEFTPQPELPR